MEIKEKITRITAIDFFNGIFAILALRDYKTLLFNKRFEEAIAEIFQEFMKYAEQGKVELRFRIRLHWFHGDSETIQNGIFTAMQIGIITLDGPGNRIIRIKLTEDAARAILDDISGRNLFIELADKIIDILSH